MQEVSVITNRYNKVLKKLLFWMKQDEFMSIIKKDEILLLFGIVELNRKEKQQDIGYTLRVIGKVLNLLNETEKKQKKTVCFFKIVKMSI